MFTYNNIFPSLIRDDAYSLVTPFSVGVVQSNTTEENGGVGNIF